MRGSIRSRHSCSHIFKNNNNPVKYLHGEPSAGRSRSFHFIRFVNHLRLNARKKTTVGDKPGSKLERQKILKYAYVRGYLVITALYIFKVP